MRCPAGCAQWQTAAWRLYSRWAAALAVAVVAVDVVAHLTTHAELSGERAARQLHRALEYADIKTDESITTLQAQALPVVGGALVGAGLLRLLLTVVPRFAAATASSGKGRPGSPGDAGGGARCVALSASAADAALRHTSAAAFLLFLGGLADASAVTARLMNTKDSSGKAEVVRAYAVVKAAEAVLVVALLWRLYLWSGRPGRDVQWRLLRALAMARDGDAQRGATAAQLVGGGSEATAALAVDAAQRRSGGGGGGAAGVAAAPLDTDSDDGEPVGELERYAGAQDDGGSGGGDGDDDDDDDNDGTRGLQGAASGMARAVLQQARQLRRRSSRRPAAEHPAGGPQRAAREGAEEAALERASSAVWRAAEAVEARAALEAAGGLLARHRRRWHYPVLMLICLLASTVAWEFRVIVNFQGELVPDSVIGGLSVRAAAPRAPLHASNASVVVVLLDGCRHDRVLAVPRFAQLLADPALAPDLLLREARARLPAMSVPNWLALLTGAEPEVHGVLGNILIPETRLDTMFSVAQAFGLHRGLAASPAFEAVVRSSLPLLSGAAVVDYAYDAGRPEATRPPPSNFLMDELLTNVSVGALAGGGGYRLWLLYNNDVDLQGHCCGVTEKWNAAGSYDAAVGDKADNVRRVLDAVDNDTVVIVTADHGHVDPGGHGGVDDALYRVPLVVYKRGSGLGSASLGGAPSLRPAEEEEEERWEGQPHASTLLDVAASVTALLGLPPPGTSQGVILPFALHLTPPEHRLAHYQALLRQQQALYNAVVLSVAPALLEKNGTLDAAIHAPVPANVDDCAAAVRALRAAYRATRVDIVAEQTTAVLSFSLVLVVAALAYFAHAVASDAVVQGGAFACVGCRARCAPRATAATRARCRETLLVLAASGTLVGAFYGVTLGAMVAVFAELGYTRLDSTLLAHESVLEAYFSTTLFASCGLALLLVGGYHAALAAVPAPPRRGEVHFVQRIGDHATGALRRACALSRASGVGFRRLRLLYLLQVLTLAWATAAALATVAVRASYTQATPLGFRVKFLGGDTWSLRFRVMAVQTITLPLLALSWWVHARFPRVRHNAAWARFLSVAEPLRDPRAKQRQQDDAGVELPEVRYLSVGAAVVDAGVGGSAGNA